MAATSSLNRSAGVSHPRVLRGRLVEEAAMSSRSCLAVDRQVGAFGEELADEAVPVLVGAALPG